jgi:predicted nucleotidyltransferase
MYKIYSRRCTKYTQENAQNIRKKMKKKYTQEHVQNIPKENVQNISKKMQKIFPKAFFAVY